MIATKLRSMGLHAGSFPPRVIVSSMDMDEYRSRLTAFWAEQRRLLLERASDPAIVACCLERMASEQRRGVPLNIQLSFEAAAAEAAGWADTVAAARAETIKKTVAAEALAEQGRKGGRAKGQDALQCLIEDIVARNPAITRSELLDRLREQEGQAVIAQIHDGLISFDLPNGGVKSAPLSGLKDRLSRAKKKFLRSAPRQLA